MDSFTINETNERTTHVHGPAAEGPPPRRRDMDLLQCEINRGNHNIRIRLHIIHIRIHYCCVPNFGRCGRSQDRVSVNCPMADSLYPAEWMAVTQFGTVDHLLDIDGMGQNWEDAIQCVLVIRESFTREYGSRVFHSGPCRPLFTHFELNQLSLITRTHCIIQKSECCSNSSSGRIEFDALDAR